MQKGGSTINFSRVTHRRRIYMKYSCDQCDGKLFLTIYLKLLYYR